MTCKQAHRARFRKQTESRLRTVGTEGLGKAVGLNSQAEEELARERSRRKREEGEHLQGENKCKGQELSRVSK